MKNIRYIMLNVGLLLLFLLLIPVRDLRAEDPGAGAAPVVKAEVKDDKSDLEEAPLDARYDAARQVSRAKWASCGCLGNYLGVAASLLFVASPRIERLLGKSPDYVMLYTRAYKKTMRSQQARWAALGCATSTCLLTAFLIAVASDDAVLDCGPDITCGLNDDCQSIIDNTNDCLDASQSCGTTSENCSNSLGDCSPDCSPDCSSPDCKTPSCGSPDCGGSDCGTSDNSCGGSSSDCGGSSSSCGSLTETADLEIPQP